MMNKHRLVYILKIKGTLLFLEVYYIDIDGYRTEIGCIMRE